MRLPNGVTGFYNSEADKPPQTDGKQFKQLCFSVAANNAGRILEFNSPRYPANFYSAYVEMCGNQFYILLNEHYPFIAFASIVDDGNLEFKDEPVLFQEFKPFYDVLTVNELNELIKHKPQKNELNPAEWKQIFYWKPGTVGQILFNYWD
ncbi:hypothetical protein [Planococcus shenhongbingii]|uniref:Uncharacterized protein n=1 Tax=Planococcus shenhongbingii TaxID=3058398 RepID=A0ABT8N803_9BACL|nr:hypothetical protein [Planococcus sp. N017]MDN7244004.1 hypothetical protein [Planococcus sp. N017]